MHHFFKSQKFIPLLFAGVVIISYGLLLPFTGFYWDDLPFAWIAKFLGPAEFIPAFRDLRPFLGPIFFVTTSLVPPEPLYWQIFALVIRFLSGLSAWFALNQIFPNSKRQTLIASLLFLVFPGYSQHWVAFTHINQEWIPFIFYLLSFGFTARALRNRNSFTSNTVYALLLLIAGVFPTEYFLGLEPMRFLFIWVILSEETSSFWQRFNKTLKYWLPYLLIWLANVAWLAYFYTAGSYESYDVEVVKEPLTVVHIFSAMGDAVWKAGFYIWGQVIVLAARSISAPTTLFMLVIVAIAFFLLMVYLVKFAPFEGGTRTFAGYAILIGLAGILLGRVPSFAAGLPLTLQSSYDRFMISMMLGGTLFIAGWIELLVRSTRVKTYIFVLLISLGIGQQFFNANIFRRDWARQQEIYRQLAWRIPAMKPNTVLLTHQMPVDYETDNSFTAPINWMYAPNFTGGDLPYLLVYTGKRLGGSTLTALAPDIPIRYPYRTVSFNGNTSQAIVIYMPVNGCLRVLDPALGDEETYEKQPRSLTDAIPLSDPSRILTDPAVPATPVFFSDTKHGWCYYYARAELARQTRDWQQIIALQDEANEKGHAPKDVFELLPFIEANAMLANFKQAEQLSIDTVAGEPRVRKGVCNVWKRVQAEGPAGDDAGLFIARMLSRFQCER
jgi:hypothetical protein